MTMLTMISICTVDIRMTFKFQGQNYLERLLSKILVMTMIFASEAMILTVLQESDVGPKIIKEKLAQ